MTKIDAHIHFRGDHPEARALLEELGLKVLNICVASNPRWREIEAEPYQRLAQQCPDRFAWCTSFDVPDGQPDYADRIIAGLERDFAAGAVGCKAWKNIGMEVRNACGDFLMIDNSIFDPI